MSDPRQGERRATVETLTISNSGTTPCRLGGERQAQAFVVQALSPDKVNDVLRADGYGGDSVLGPGESATTEITTSSTFGFDDDRCLPKQVGAFRITPPAAADPVVVPAALRSVCTNPAIGGTPLAVGGLPTRG